MEREIFIMRDGAVLWRGAVRPPTKSGAPAAALDYYQLAWRTALEQGAVGPGDAETIVFRFSPPR